MRREVTEYGSWLRRARATAAVTLRHNRPQNLGSRRQRALGVLLVSAEAVAGELLSGQLQVVHTSSHREASFCETNEVYLAFGGAPLRELYVLTAAVGDPCLPWPFSPPSSCVREVALEEPQFGTRQRGH